MKKRISEETSEEVTVQLFKIPKKDDGVMTIGLKQILDNGVVYEVRVKGTEESLEDITGYYYDLVGLPDILMDSISKLISAEE